MIDEIYSVDICKNKDLALYGGKDEEVEIFNYKEEIINTKIIFEESIVYNKFIEENIVIVTLDGVLTIIDKNNENNTIELNTEITYVKYEKYLLIGTIKGEIFIYDIDLNHLNTITTHDSEILQIDYKENKIISISDNLLVVHNEYNKILYSNNGKGFKVFKYLSNDLLMFYKENKMFLYKNNIKLYENEIENIEHIERINNTIIFGGIEKMVFLELKKNYSIFEYKTDLNITGIKKYKENEIIIICIDGKIGKIDIRDINSLKTYQSKIETIYDYKIDQDLIIIGGNNGYEILNINEILI